MVVIDKSRRVLELLLTTAAWDETLQYYLLQLLVGPVTCKCQLSNDSNGLAVLLDLSNELTDVLVLERESVYLQMPVSDEEAVVKELR